MTLSKDLYDITPEVIVQTDYRLTWRALSETVSRIVEPDKDLLKQRAWGFTNGRSFWSGKVLTERDQFGRWMDPRPGLVEWDHLIPAHKGGLSVTYNLLPATREENQLKSGMDPLTFFRFRQSLGMKLRWKTEEDFLLELESFNGLYYDSLDGVFCYDPERSLPSQLMEWLIDHEEEWAPPKKYPYWQDIAVDRKDFPELVKLSHYSHPCYAVDSRGKRTKISRRKKVSQRFGKMIRIFFELFPERDFYDLTQNEWMVVAREVERRTELDQIPRFYLDEFLKAVGRARRMREQDPADGDG